MAIFTAIASVFAAVGTFLGTLGAVGTFLLQTAVGIGLNYLAQAIAGKPKQPGFSVQGKLRASGDVPRSFVVGRGCTAGSLVYVNTWSSGGTPNAYLTQVIALSDLPVKALAEVWVNGALCTLDSVAHVDRGFPVLEYRKNGKDHLWVKFYDGTQTTVDAFLVNSVSSSERPYNSTRVGYGVAHVIVTALVNEELFSGFPEYKFALDGVKFYDPSQDDTAGGEGDQRWNDPATWGGDGDDLPAVQLYNLLRGITYDDEWFYGLQGVAAARLPAADWIAQIGKCRAEVNGPDGKEPAYRTGGEIPVGAQIADGVESLLTGCQGRLAEFGGVYTVRVGAPGSAEFAITDDDILSTEEQSFTPFFGLADTITGITAKYPSPEEAWNIAVAPPLYRSDLESLAGNRRLLADVSLDLVPYKGQVQRLMKSAIAEGQRARRHTITLPPKFWAAAVPGAILSWTSARNGYVTKLFRIDGAVDKANLDVMIDITEVDPADYDWDQETDYTEPVIAPVGPIRPPPQVMTGWQALPAIIESGGRRRPSIEVRFEAGLEDVRAVHVQARFPDTLAVVFDGEVPYTDTAGSVVLNGTFLGDTDYEVRGRFVPFSARPTEWSSWLAVTTENVGIGEGELDAKVRAWLQQLDTTKQAALGPVLDEIRDRVDALGHTTAGLVALLNERVEGSIVNYIGLANAAITEVRTVAEGLADLFVDVFVGDEIRSANGLFRITAAEGPGGVGTSINLEARAMVADLFKAAGISIYAYADEDGGQSGVEITGDKVTIITPSGERLNALLFTAQDTPRDTPITVENDTDVVRVDLSGRQSRHKVVLTSDVEMRAPVSATSMDFSLEVHQDDTGNRDVTFSDEFVPPKPVLSGSALLPSAINIIDHKILSLNPMRIAASLFGTFTDTPIFSYRDYKGGGGATAGTSQLPFVFRPAPGFGSRLNFGAGNLLVVFAYGQSINTNGNFGNSADITDNAVSNWNSIVSVAGNLGGPAHRHRIRALWKIADGSEGSIQPFVYSSTSTRHATAVYSIIAFDFLGGTMTLDTNVNASVDAAATQTIKTGDHAAPALALSFAGDISDTGATPSVDQSFSVTPDGNFTEAPLDGNPGGRWRLKYRLFDSSPTDVTTALDNAAVASCAFYLQ